ncbi:hypothetical protein CHS0354_021493 [Potamilus streckersoni]|uniref:Uncharacterized protein n=1 Tax=Potamilus streckersoni TaxID=2493646 RepID=A0AAE0SC54_9BIVA|nr:hypothetical protein CHS0354_021493 [Potamilus streckersoni]
MCSQGGGAIFSSMFSQRGPNFWSVDFTGLPKVRPKSNFGKRFSDKILTFCLGFNAGLPTLRHQSSSCSTGEFRTSPVHGSNRPPRYLVLSPGITQGIFAPFMDFLALTDKPVSRPNPANRSRFFCNSAAFSVRSEE